MHSESDRPHTQQTPKNVLDTPPTPSAHEERGSGGEQRSSFLPQIKVHQLRLVTYEERTPTPHQGQRKNTAEKTPRETEEFRLPPIN